MNQTEKIRHPHPPKRKTKAADKRRLYRAGRESKAYTLPQMTRKEATR